MIRITIEELQELVDHLKNRNEYGNMASYVNVEISKHPNGRQFIEFEQPCNYSECNSSYRRYDEERPTTCDNLSRKVGV